MPEVWLEFFESLLNLAENLEIGCNSLAERIAEIAKRYLDADFVYIDVWNLKKNSVFCHAQYGLPWEVHNLSFENSITSRIISDMNLGRDTFKDRNNIPSALDEMVGPVIFYPITVSDELAGAICLGRRKGKPDFSKDDELKLLFISIVVKLVIYNRLMKERFNKLFSTFNILQILLPVVATEIILEENPEELVSDLVDKLKTFFNADKCVFVRVEGEEISIVHQEGLIFFERGFIRGKGLVGTIVETGKPILLEDYRRFAREQELSLDDVPCDPDMVGTGMGVPIEVDGRLIGVVALCRRVGKPSFDEFDFEALKIFQNFFTVIFKVARLKDEKKKQEQLLNRAQRFESLGILAGGIAHDFNNIINIIIGLSEIAKLELRNENIDRAQIENYLNSIIEQGKSAANLIKQILDFARRSSDSKQILNLAPFMKEMVKLFSRTVRSDITFSLHFDPEEKYYIYADPTSIHQVIMNIVLNAVEAMPKGGHIDIVLRKVKIDENSMITTLSPGTYIAVDIKDTGVGIPPEILDKIFDPFFTTKPDGTGLGLAQVYGIVKNLGGEILVESEVDKGTCFTILIPEAEGKLVEEKEQSSLKDWNIFFKNKRVLIVEDRAKLAETLSMILRSVGCEVDTASTCQEAYNRLSHADYHVIVVDVMLPDGSGIDVVKFARRLGRKVRSVVISGYKPSELSVSDIEKYADAFLSKPFTMKELLDVLRKVLEDEDE